MEPNIQPNIEHPQIEKHLEQVSQELREKQIQQKIEKVDKPVIKHYLQEKTVAAPQPQKHTAATDNDLPQYLKQESPEIKNSVEELINMTFDKGINASVAEAKKCGPFILDAFHDTLTSKLYDELKKRKLI